MVSRAELQYAYVKLYTELRKYIWSYPTVSALADLEISVYQIVPDIDIVRNNFYRLRSLVVAMLQTDESMKKAFDRFCDTMNSGDACYSKILDSTKG